LNSSRQVVLPIRGEIDKIKYKIRAAQAAHLPDTPDIPEMNPDIPDSKVLFP